MEDGAGARSYAPAAGLDAEGIAAGAAGAAAGGSKGLSKPSPRAPPVAWTLGSWNGLCSDLSSNGLSAIFQINAAGVGDADAA